MSLPAMALTKGESHTGTFRPQQADVNNSMDVDRYLRDSMAA